MKSQSRWKFLLFAGFTAVLLNGCGSGDLQLSSVSGTVTLDDRPLSDATVEFQPDSGSFSEGVTDSSGNYTLRYNAKKKGALPGKHQVRITHSTRVDAQGQKIDGPQLLPARYNRFSELAVEVKSGSNKLDFPLKSK
ncbi:MAG: carboxypeptidase-like regulatory domain-containing protein [Planctomycetota bacterium]|nr:carboxypeptidase-like regulatory domain-containing protein [Planctomycetota bacterium]